MTVTPENAKDVPMSSDAPVYPRGEPPRALRLKAPGVSRRTVVKSAIVPALALAAHPTKSASESTTMATSEDQLPYMSATAQAALIRSGDLASEELVARYLERIERFNPKLNAVVALADDARERAREADRARAEGRPLGRLHGVPMTIKDCFDTAGVVSTWGTMGRKDFVPDADATVVARLKEAGAILLGKTNTPEFTLSFETHNNIHGFTNNPYDLERSPGGSSGGAAAAIAAGLTSFDIGTDYGGSIRVPSHSCGTVGIKPTSGSVPRTGLCLPPGMLTDYLSHAGPMARTVDDLELILSLIWGPDGLDTRIQPIPLAASDAVDLAGLRCAVMVDNGVATPDEDTMAAVEAAEAILGRAGLAMQRDRLDGVEETTALGGGFWPVGAHAGVRALLDQAGTEVEDYANNWFRQLAQSGGADEIPAAALTRQLARFEDYRRRMQQHMARYDVLISPVNAHPAPRHPAPGDSPFPTGDASYTEAYDLTGWPAGVVRGGTSSEGIPIGVQVVANPWRENIVLAVMRHLEASLPAFSGPDEGRWES